jgi:hypothetical protein
MQIRETQLQTLETASIRAFEDRTYAHLQRYFPRHCALVGETQMRKVIQQGWTKSASYGLTAECCVRSYIEFMCLLGSSFDMDPLLPWAAKILNDTSTSDQIERGDRLYDRAWEYIDHIIPDFRDAAGQPITARFIAELKKLRSMPDELVTTAILPEFTHRARDRLEQVFPAKSRYVGEQAVNQAIADAIGAARSYGLTGEQGTWFVVVLKFLLGTGFDKDPLLPWASATLSDSATSDPRKRLNKLYVEGAGFLRQWWDSAPRRAI